MTIQACTTLALPDLLLGVLVGDVTELCGVLPTDEDTSGERFAGSVVLLVGFDPARAVVLVAAALPLLDVAAAVAAGKVPVDPSVAE